MGLDMYLSAKKYLYDGELRTELNQVAKEVLGHMSIKYIVAEAAYWRKANAIHQWFVDNVQDGDDDCGEYYVAKEQIRTLLCNIDAILADNSLAEELLPPQSGFFFGSTDVDEYYFEDLKHTKEMLVPLLDPKFKDWDFYYRSSW